MNRKNKPSPGGYVYSTDPGFQFSSDGQEIRETLPPEKQKLRIRLDTKQRAGKAVSLVEGFIGREEDLEALGKKLKGFCGSGGSVKEGVIIIQGDQRDKLLSWLISNKYQNSKKG